MDTLAALASNLGYYDDDEGDRAAVYIGEPIRSACVPIRRDTSPT